MPTIFKLDYALEREHAARRHAAQLSPYARASEETAARKLRRLAKGLAVTYLNHQSWKAHDGVFMPFPLDAAQEKDESFAQHCLSLRRLIRKLSGVKLSEVEAHAAWPHILEHKWYLSERLGRDAGLRVAVVDYFDNIQPPRARLSWRANRYRLPPKLPLMMPFNQWLSL